MAFCVLHGIGRDLAREGALLEIRDIIPILAFILQGSSQEWSAGNKGICWDLVGKGVLEI